MSLLLFFLMGIVQDFLIAKYYLALSRRSAIVASILGMAITFLTMKVFNVTFGKDLAFLAYALGTGVGTFLGCNHGRR
jgi:predicted lysophospholipase L1 biosynthesis ABC-type transport system permease subunit